jgi:PAS domain-containing protein
MTATQFIALSDLQEISEAAPGARMVVDRTGRIIVANSAGESLFGYAAGRPQCLSVHFGGLLAAKRVSPSDGS